MNRSIRSRLCAKTDRIITGLVVLFLGLGLAACIPPATATTPVDTAGQEALGPDWEESGQIHQTVNHGESPLDIARGGFETWLSQYSQANTPLEARLEDYRIDRIEAVSDPFFAGDYDFVFRIEYSVRPAHVGFVRWLAGDGREGQDGWVVGKLHYVGVRVVDGKATLFILGPCPMC
ncbi:MAG: hypothetical protein PVG63_03310 [Anaerolineales bacterium]